MPEPIIHGPETRPEALAVIGEKLTVMASSDETGGYELFLQDGLVGHGPPPHHHAWDEAFFVLSGRIDFGVGDREMSAGPGTLVHVPGGTVHWFRFVEDGQMFSVTGQGSGAAKFFTQIHHEVAGPEDIPNLIKAGADHDVTFPPPEG